MMPHILFQKLDCNYSIYIDSNIKVIGDLTGMINQIGKYGLSFYHHRERDCVYSECKAAQMLGKISKKQLNQYVDYLKKINMPYHFGLPECNIIVRNHKQKQCIEIMNLWWDEFQNGQAKRDQLYMPIALYKKNITPEKVMTLGSNCYYSPLIQIVFHK